MVVCLCCTEPVEPVHTEAHRGNIPPPERVRAEETYTDTSSRREMHRIA